MIIFYTPEVVIAPTIMFLMLIIFLPMVKGNSLASLTVVVLLFVFLIIAYAILCYAATEGWIEPALYQAMNNIVGG